MYQRENIEKRKKEGRQASEERKERKNSLTSSSKY